jgi:hypothetical protein
VPHSIEAVVGRFITALWNSGNATVSQTSVFDTQTAHVSDLESPVAN